MTDFADSLKGRTVLITGAGKGIGRALAERLSTYGARVLALSRTEEDLINLQSKCPGIIPVVTDLAKWDDTRKRLEQAIAQSETAVDVVINNAAIGDFQTLLLDHDGQSFDKIFNTNLKSILNVSQVCVRKMIAEKIPGRIVNISSISAQRPASIAPLYSTTKAALDMLTKLMAIEWGAHEIRVNSINLGFVHSHAVDVNFGGLDGMLAMEKALNDQKRLPLGTILTPMDQAVDSILFLASPNSPGMMTGGSIQLDGGFSLTGL